MLVLTKCADLRRHSTASAISQLRRRTAKIFRHFLPFLLPTRLPSTDSPQLRSIDPNIRSQSPLQSLDRIAPVPHRGESTFVAWIDKGLRIAIAFARGISEGSLAILVDGGGSASCRRRVERIHQSRFDNPLTRSRNHFNPQSILKRLFSLHPLLPRPFLPPQSFTNLLETRANSFDRFSTHDQESR